jgi:hypothetical protein
MESGSPSTGIFEPLLRRGVPFVVIGGVAVGFYGRLRATEDTDIIFLRDESSEENLFLALMDLDAAFISDEIDPSTNLERLIPVSKAYVRNSRLMMLCTRLGYLDIFDYVPGIEEQDVRDLINSAVKSAAGVPHVSLEWLLKIKKSAGRAKDLEDAEILTRTKLRPES